MLLPSEERTTVAALEHAVLLTTLARRLRCLYFDVVRCRWTMKALSGRVRLGRVLMRAEDPVVLRPGGDVKGALLEVYTYAFYSLCC